MHKDIIKVDFNTLVQEWHKHFVHVSLKAGRSVCKPKSHDLHSIQSERCHKHSFPFIAGLDLDLIISRLQIELGEEFQSLKLIHHFIDMRQWVTILNPDLVQILIVDNQLSGSVLFPHEEHQCGNWTFWIGWFHYPHIHPIVEEFMTLSTLLLVHLVRATWLQKQL